MYKILQTVQTHKFILNMVKFTYFLPEVTNKIDSKKHVQNVIKKDPKVKVTIVKYLVGNFCDKLQ